MFPVYYPDKEMIVATAKKKLPPAKRLAIYRQRAEKSGMRRVEVAVPATDVSIIRNFARVFREGGSTADHLRRQGKLIGHSLIAKTGAELVAVLRRNIDEGIDLNLPPRGYEEPRDVGV
jgi:hypothetical protein